MFYLFLVRLVSLTKPNMMQRKNENEVNRPSIIKTGQGDVVKSTIEGLQIPAKEGLQNNRIHTCTTV